MLPVLDLHPSNYSAQSVIQPASYIAIHPYRIVYSKNTIQYNTFLDVNGIDTIKYALEIEKKNKHYKKI